MVRIAMKAALKSDHMFRHGAIVLKGGAIQAVGHNHNGVHAEVDALEKLEPENRVGTVVWSIRITGSGERISNAKPCPNCMQYLLDNGVKGVYYSTTDREIKYMRLRRPKHDNGTIYPEVQPQRLGA